MTLSNAEQAMVDTKTNHIQLVCSGTQYAVKKISLDKIHGFDFFLGGQNDGMHGDDWASQENKTLFVWLEK